MSVALIGLFFGDTIPTMTPRKRGRGRPPKGSGEVKSLSVLLRVDPGEKQGFSGASAKSPDARDGGHARRPPRPVPPPAAPDERVPVGVPVGGRPLYRPA